MTSDNATIPSVRHQYDQEFGQMQAQVQSGVSLRLTDELWAVMLRCWARESHARPSAGEVANELERIRLGMTVWGHRLIKVGHKERCYIANTYYKGVYGVYSTKRTIKSTRTWGSKEGVRAGSSKDIYHLLVINKVLCHIPSCNIWYMRPLWSMSNYVTRTRRIRKS